MTSAVGAALPAAVVVFTAVSVASGTSLASAEGETPRADDAAEPLLLAHRVILSI